ncbi:MAG TPA: protein phosphatase 2C domain-containing protein [Anaerolineales bacterium]|nr:protein phosphatase 2C domain-containing protein [Anaerolineales bacterium]
MSNILQKIFGKPEKEILEIQDQTTVDTAPLTDEQLQSITLANERLEPAQFMVGSGRSVGRQRDHNEDALFVFSSTLAAETTSHPFGIFMIADGMGGHQQGEVASEVAIRAMLNHLMRRIFAPMFGITPETPQESLQEIMTEGIAEAHNTVLRLAPGGGTTMTSVMIIGSRMTVAHVGDSRAYAIYLDGRMQVLTRDHSLVRRLEELGQITPEEASSHPQRHVLYRALGLGEPVDPDVFTAPSPHPGYLLICSDGLWGVVPETDIFRIISTSPNLHKACLGLIEAANAAGGPDNISVILVRMPD